jgi:hypothetical protein
VPKREVKIAYQITIAVDIDGWVTRSGGTRNGHMTPEEFYGHHQVQTWIAEAIADLDLNAERVSGYRPVITVTRVRP